MIASPHTGRILRVAPVDYPFSREGTHPITFVYYFEQRQDFRSLREALATTLDGFYPVKGRLVEEGDELFVVESLESELGAATFEESELAEMPRTGGPRSDAAVRRGRRHDHR
jgi:hypothetical protein